MSVSALPGRPADPLSMFWFIPTHGDGTYLGSERDQRPAEFPYFKQVAQAVDQLGYEGVLLPTGQSCEDSWITATGLAVVTERLKYLVALRPGVVSPAFAARQTAALDRLSRGRLLLNVVVGGNPAELAGDGVFLPHDERYAQADEFLTVWRRLLSGETLDFEGQYYRVKGGRIDFPPVQEPHPPLWFGGSSDAGQDVAADHVDTYLTWGEPVDAVAEKIGRARAKAAARGRRLRFGMRLHFIVRETSDEAWAAADRLISRVSDAQIEAAQARFSQQMDSVGQKRMAALHGGRRDRLVIAPNLWAGVGLVRTGAGTALVGSPDEVAERLREYQAVGIDTVIGSGYPHLEEAYRVAELLFPKLGIDNAPGRLRSSIANEFSIGHHGARSQARLVSALRLSRGTLGWALPLAILAGWEAASRLGEIGANVLPAPTEVAGAALRLARSGELARNVWVSSLRALSGLVVGGGIGLALGLANGLSGLSRTLTDTTLQMVRNVPHLALIPLVILWFGIDEEAKLFLVALGVFFPIYLNTLHGIRSVDPQLLEMGRVYGMGGPELFRRVVLPGALPSIFVGLRYALGIMWLTLIVAETVSASSGIGYMAMQAREFQLLDVVVLSILIYALLGKLADVIARGLERVTLRWNPAYQTA